MLKDLCCVQGRVLAAMILVGGAYGSHAQDRRTAAVAAPVFEERAVGPYDVHVLAGGPALNEPVTPASEMLTGEGAFTLSLWMEMTASTPREVLLAGVGDPAAENSRFLGIHEGRAMLRYGAGNALLGNAPLPASGWHWLAATSDGTTATLSVDGREVARGALLSGAVAPRLVIAPTTIVADVPAEHFGGDLVQVMLRPGAMAAKDQREAASHAPDPTLLRWHDASLSWPVQTRGQAGYLEPQDASLMPVSRAALGKPVAKPLPPPGAAALESLGDRRWAIRAQWKLAAAPEVTATGAVIASSGFADMTKGKTWMHATVPGTVLTSMVDRGIYPDPDFGLNNLAIPESLNKQDYWYRIEFEAPHEAAGQHASLTFLGINYAAEVWLNGQRLGDVRGAFVRERSTRVRC